MIIGSPLEPEDVKLEIVLTLRGMLVSEDEELELEIVLGKVELLGVLIVEIMEIDEILPSTGNEEVDDTGIIEDVFSPIVEKELG